MQPTQDSESPFKYFLRPHHFSTYSAAPETCYFCGQLAAGYRGRFYSTTEINFVVCEPCLLKGKPAEVSAQANEGNKASLLVQLKRLQPELPNAETQQLAASRTFELEHCTPHPLTWQHLIWPTHCGDYCCYLKEAGKPDLLAIAPDGNVLALVEYQPDLLEVAPDPDSDVLLWRDYVSKEHFNNWWEGVRPDSPKDNSIAYSMGVYLFQCLHCQKYIILWDQD